MRRTQFATIAAASLMLSLAACGEEKPDPIPSSSSSPTPTVEVSPPPSEPELTAKQKAAYDQALERYTEFQDFAAKLSQNPKVDDDVINSVAEYMTLDGADSFSDSLDELIRNEARIEGEREVAWTTPVKVTDTAVTFKQCETPGSWVLVGKDGTKAPQDENTVTDATIKKVEKRWYVDSVRSGGSC